MTEPKLTKQQKRVKALLEQGKNPTQIARSLKTTRNNVYGHMRRMRNAGVKLPGDDTPRRGRPRKPGSQAIPPSPNGTRADAMVQVRQLVEDAIQRADERVGQIEERVTSISEQEKVLANERESLSAEAKALTDKRDALVDA